MDPDVDEVDDFDEYYGITQLTTSGGGMRMKYSGPDEHLVIIRGGSGFCYKCAEDVIPTKDGKCPRRARAEYRADARRRNKW